ncbi:hypothetical protein FHS45_000668 [Thalassobacillus devorans]|nr:hypothetical protein [Thalassobacillus devorans]NIK27577.1 hypothetical protein [Thalassobacillus devorans]
MKKRETISKKYEKYIDVRETIPNLKETKEAPPEHAGGASSYWI